MIPDNHMAEHCRPGQQADTCRYLNMRQGNWLCAKHTALQVVLDRRVAEDAIIARGDNCPGLDC